MVKPHESDQAARATAIATALKAAQRNDRDDFLRALEGISIRRSAEAPIEERWLAAELAFRRGQFTRTIELFEAFERDRRSAQAPPWQRYRSCHRRAFSYLHQGNDERSWQVLREAEERLRLVPGVDPQPPDLHGMYGHLLNHRGDFERARARFALGYERAVATGVWGRAAGNAADVSMMLLRLNRLTEAREWLDRAEAALRRGPNSLTAATIEVRRGLVYRAMEMDEVAEAHFQSVIESLHPHPDPLEAAFRGRAEVRLSRHNFAGAESDLRAAIAVCLSQDLRGHAAAARRDLAHHYLARGQEGDENLAVQEFRRALGLLFTLRPPRPDLLMDFAEEMVRRPALVAGTLREDLKGLIWGQVEQLRAVSQPHPFAEIARAREATVAYRTLSMTVRRIAASHAALRQHTVNLLTGAVVFAKGRKRLGPTQLVVLQYLLDQPRGLTIEEVSDGLGIELVAGSRRMMRLKAALGDDLATKREGNARRYSLRFPERVSCGKDH